MKKIAITGNIASGKSTVENFIREKGYEIFDADEICHIAMQENTEIIAKIIETYKNVIDKDGNIDRKELGEIVFADNKAKALLENILHPYVKEMLNEFFKRNSDKDFVFASIPLLFEAQMENIFDEIILVCADENIRLQRLMNRNNLTQEHAYARIKAQMPQEEKIKLADYKIINDADLISLKTEVINVLEKITY